MIPRYATPSMTAVWSDEARWSAALQVELAVLIQEPDNGQSEAINKGFRHASGEILGWINSDDFRHTFTRRGSPCRF